MSNATRVGAGWLMLALPFTLAVVFSSAFSPPFASPKNTVFVFATFLLAALALISASEWRPKSDERYFWFATATYLALSVASAVMSKWRYMCIESVLFMACGVLLFAAARVTLAKGGRAPNVRHLQNAITAAAALVSLATLIQFFGGNAYVALGNYFDPTSRMRIYGTLGNPDFVAAFLAVSVPGAVALSIAGKRLRALWMAASALIGVAVILTGSRGGLIALAAGVTVVVLSLTQRRTVITVAVVIACTLSAGTRLNSRTPCESLRGRILIWQVSLNDGAARSAFGNGPGTFVYLYPLRLGQFFAGPGREPLLRFVGHERHAQNDYVEAWHDTGWLGLFSLLALLGSWFALVMRRLRESDDHRRPAVAAAIASVSALCVASLFDFPMHRAETWALLWLCMAVPLVSPATSPGPKRCQAVLRYAGAALLIVVGSYLAFAPLAASYELAKGESDENQERLESSLKAYRVALRLDPSSPDANFDLVRAIAKTGEYSGALAQSKIASRYVNEPELYILRSRILQIAGRNSEALAGLVAASRLFTYSTELRDELVLFLSP